MVTVVVRHAIGSSLVPRPPLFLPSVCIHNNTQERKTAITNLPILCIIVNTKGRSKWGRPGNKALLRVRWNQQYLERLFISSSMYTCLLKPKMLKVPLKVHSCSIHQNWYAQNFCVPKANLVNYDLAKIVQTGIYIPMHWVVSLVPRLLP